MNHIVVDVEIQKTIGETPGGWDATDKLGVAVACVWEYQGQRMRIFGPDDRKVLQDRLLRADKISGFNIWGHDFPTIWGISRPDWDISIRRNDADFVLFRHELRKILLPKTNDILRRIWLSLGLDADHFSPRTHGGYSLDRIVQALFNSSKIGYGGDAPKWFQEGQWARVANYCADDVALERDLTDFVDRYGYIIDPKTNRQLIISAPMGV